MKYYLPSICYYKRHDYVSISLGRFKFLHQGHCGGTGYVLPNTVEETIDDCRKECESRDEVKYFAYVSKSTCACYKTECYFDGQHMDHIAYEILDSGYQCFALSFA